MRISRWSAAAPALAVATLCGCPARQPDVSPPTVAEPEVYISPLATEHYPWCTQPDRYEPLAARFPAPPGFERVPVADRSWGQWLRHLPMLPAGAPVRSQSGAILLDGDSPSLAGVVDMDVRENQECADVILRLRAEYLRWAGREDEIVFNLTGSGAISWPEWRRGMRPRLQGDTLAFHRSAKPDASRESFDRYLAWVFAWCGTISPAEDGHTAAFEELAVGDYLAHDGSPGHAVLLVDLARDSSRKAVGLVLQGFMPAQTPHLVAGDRGAWHGLASGRPVEVPWGRFDWADLRRF